MSPRVVGWCAHGYSFQELRRSLKRLPPYRDLRLRSRDFAGDGRTMKGADFTKVPGHGPNPRVSGPFGLAAVGRSRSRRRSSPRGVVPWSTTETLARHGTATERDLVGDSARGFDREELSCVELHDHQRLPVRRRVDPVDVETGS
jgi:hypothetical protein